MKRLIILIALVVSTPVFADDVLLADYPKAPEWKDFCEAGYENAVYKKSNDVFNYLSFVKAERAKKNYWAQRRESFEKYLKTCNELTDESKYACYAQLTASENNKNELYKSKREFLLYETNIERH